MKIFVSSYSPNRNFAKQLIERLRDEGFILFHSPLEDDLRWNDWYEKGFEKELLQTNFFIAVIDEVWSSSTWMAHESDIAHKFLRENKIKKAYFWNPEEIEIKSVGMKSYLKKELPKNIDKLIIKLKQ